MVEIKLLGRVKYQNEFYSANDVITVDNEIAEYLQEKKVCKVLAIVEPTKEVEEKTEKPVKKSKKVKQEGK